MWALKLVDVEARRVRRPLRSPSASGPPLNQAPSDEAQNDPGRRPSLASLPRKSSKRPAPALRICPLPGPQSVARPGLEPGTPRFSVVCSTN